MDESTQQLLAAGISSSLLYGLRPWFEIQLLPTFSDINLDKFLSSWKLGLLCLKNWD